MAVRALLRVHVLEQRHGLVDDHLKGLRHELRAVERGGLIAAPSNRVGNYYTTRYGDAWEALGDGFRVEVRIVVDARQDVLKVPTSSLFRRGEDWAVFAVEKGRAVLRPITLGIRNGLEAEVLDGVAAGERIIVHPSDSVAEGVRVEER